MQSKTMWFNFKMAACFVESNEERHFQNWQEDAQSDFFCHVSLGEEEGLSWGLIFGANSRTWKKLFTKFFEDELLDMWKKFERNTWSVRTQIALQFSTSNFSVLFVAVQECGKSCTPSPWILYCFLNGINAFVFKNLFVMNFSFCSYHFKVRKVYCKCKVSIWTFANAIFYWKFGTWWFCVVWRNFCAGLVVVKGLKQSVTPTFLWTHRLLWKISANCQKMDKKINVGSLFFSPFSPPVRSNFAHFQALQVWKCNY